MRAFIVELGIGTESRRNSFATGSLAMRNVSTAPVFGIGQLGRITESRNHSDWGGPNGTSVIRRLTALSSSNRLIYMTNRYLTAKESKIISKFE